MYTPGPKMSDFIFANVKSSNYTFESLQKMAYCNVISFEQFINCLDGSVDPLRFSVILRTGLNEKV